METGYAFRQKHESIVRILTKCYQLAVAAISIAVIESTIIMFWKSAVLLLFYNIQTFVAEHRVALRHRLNVEVGLRNAFAFVKGSKQLQDVAAVF
jgi:hypothetical protein